LNCRAFGAAIEDNIVNPVTGRRLAWFFAPRQQPEESGSFLKKRTKKLFVLWDVASSLPNPPENKSFLLLFFKKEALACLFDLNHRHPAIDM
jgi:hypothetical protein